MGQVEEALNGLRNLMGPPAAPSALGSKSAAGPPPVAHSRPAPLLRATTPPPQPLDRHLDRRASTWSPPPPHQRAAAAAAAAGSSTPPPPLPRRQLLALPEGTPSLADKSTGPLSPRGRNACPPAAKQALGQPAIGSVDIAAGPELQWGECAPSPWQLQLWKLEESIEQRLEASDQKFGVVMLQVERELKHEREELHRAIAELREERETPVEGVAQAEEELWKRIRGLQQAHEIQEGRATRLDEAVRNLEGQHTAMRALHDAAEEQMRAMRSRLEADTPAKRAAHLEGNALSSGDIGVVSLEPARADGERLPWQFLELQDLVLTAVAEQIEAQVANLQEVVRRDFGEISQKVEGVSKALHTEITELWTQHSQLRSRITALVASTSEKGSTTSPEHHRQQGPGKPPLTGDSTTTVETTTTVPSLESAAAEYGPQQCSRPWDGGGFPGRPVSPTRDTAQRMANALEALRRPLPT